MIGDGDAVIVGPISYHHGLCPQWKNQSSKIRSMLNRDWCAFHAKNT